MAVKGLTKNGADLLKYIVNETPELKEAIDLPVQTGNIQKIGQLIINNQRMRNAFINAVNVIALTIIVKNNWENPWEEFTEQGKIRMGTSVREMVIDLVKAHDYNKEAEHPEGFLATEIPEVYNYMHDINFKKFYKITTNDEEIAKAFSEEGELYDFIATCTENLYTSYKYDKYLVDKYQLQRRIVDGTITSKQIPNFDTASVRDNVAFMKEYSNNLTFMSKNYNPAGLLKATPFSEQRTILSTGFEAKMSTNVLATSYFKNDAELKTKLALVDGFADNNYERLAALLGDQYVPFTEAELTKLKSVVSLIISDKFFKDYYYAMNGDAETKGTNFYNPQTLDYTMWLHAWRIFSTSPFENAIVFTNVPSAVSTVVVSPKTATVMEGQELKLSAVVTSTGVTNNAVVYSVDAPAVEAGVVIRQDGILRIPASCSVVTVTVTATSVFDSSKKGTATITVEKKN